EHAEFSAQYALSAAQESNAELKLMHVISLGTAFQSDRGGLVEKAYRELEKLVPADAKEWCKPELIVEVGDPAKELLSYAETERPEPVVLRRTEGKRISGHYCTCVN